MKPGRLESQRTVPRQKSQIAVSSGGADDTSSAATAVVKCANEARPPGIAKFMASGKSVLAESLGEPGDGEARLMGLQSTWPQNPVLAEVSL